MRSKWEKGGEVGVDAGLIWIGDPCYCVTPDANEHPAETWKSFCDKLGEEYPTVKQFNYKLGHPGLGVCISSGHGDGTYPVSVIRKDGRIKSARIDFF